MAGGWNGGGLKSTEIWVAGSSQGWTKGPYLPLAIADAAGVVSSDKKTFYLIGGEDKSREDLKTIYKLHYQNGWRWTKLPQELEVARNDHVAMLVPDSFCWLKPDFAIMKNTLLYIIENSTHVFAYVFHAKYRSLICLN